MTLHARWRRFAQRTRLGCAQCGRWPFLKSGLCRRHLGKEFDRAVRKVVYGDE